VQEIRLLDHAFLRVTPTTAPSSCRPAKAC
jgi:hypothetical protein